MRDGSIGELLLDLLGNKRRSFCEFVYSFVTRLLASRPLACRWPRGSSRVKSFGPFVEGIAKHSLLRRLTFDRLLVLSFSRRLQPSPRWQQ
jgi:hypothetical protein